MLMLLWDAFSVTCFQYMRKVLICFCLIGLVSSCKDFKSWESKYTDQLVICLESEKTMLSNHLEGQIFLLSYSSFSKSKRDQEPEKEMFFDLSKKKIPFEQGVVLVLNPCGTEFSFELYNKDYYHKVTIYYDVVTSLISPEAGGLQHKYTIKKVEFKEDSEHSPKRKAPIFKNKNYKIEQSVLQKGKGKDNAATPGGHVKIFY